jgi:hypothetical protein
MARRAWRGGYVRRIVVADLVCAAGAGAAGYLTRFGPGGAITPHASFWAALALPVIWIGAMLVARSYEEDSSGWDRRSSGGSSSRP